jgi:hypothetical protein
LLPASADVFACVTPSRVFFLWAMFLRASLSLSCPFLVSPFRRSLYRGASIRRAARDHRSGCGSPLRTHPCALYPHRPWPGPNGMEQPVLPSCFSSLSFTEVMILLMTLLQSEKCSNGSSTGRCPRVYCQGQALIPVGLSDLPRLHTVKLYCPRCRDIYFPKYARHHRTAL